jgi:hypothetical protein
MVFEGVEREISIKKNKFRIFEMVFNLLQIKSLVDFIHVNWEHVLNALNSIA